MTKPFTPRFEVLPPPQRRLWSEFGSLPSSFVLYGGTAAALHLGHRASIDFDFFGDIPFDPAGLLPSLPFLQGAEVIQREPSTLSCLVDRGGPVKVSFFGVPKLKRLAPPRIAPGQNVNVASLADLAGTKVSVVQRRAEAKDYIDIDAIISAGELHLADALACGIAIYADEFNPQVTLKALSFFDDGDLATLNPDIRRRLIAAARAVDLDQLPSITDILKRDD